MKNPIIILIVLTFFIYPTYAAYHYEEGVGIVDDSGTIYDQGGNIYSYYNSHFTTLKPSCQIVPIINQETISPEDNLSISFLLSCKGKIESNQLNIYFPEGFLSNKEKAYFSQFLAGDDTTATAIWFNEKPVIDISEGKGAFIEILPVYFKEVFPNKTITFGESYSPLGHPPILFNAKSKEKIKPGDYTINVIFHYSDGNEWYQNKESIRVHVNNPIEENRNDLFFILAILALGFPWISGYIKEYYNKILSSKLGIIIKILTIIAIVLIIRLIIISL